MNDVSILNLSNTRRIETYACCIDAIIYPPKFIHRHLHHTLNTILTSNVDLHSHASIKGVLGIFLALFRSTTGSLNIIICEYNAASASFSEGSCGFFTYAASCLLVALGF